MTDDHEYLTYIQDCLEHIEKYLGGDLDSFTTNDLIQDAVLRRLEILCDTCGKLSSDLRSRHQGVNWSGISGFRNVLAHAYRSVDIGQGRTVLEGGLAQLRSLVELELKPSRDR